MPLRDKMVMAVLCRKGINMDKLYSSTDLLKFMGEHGLPKSREWLYYNEEKGKLKSPRLPHTRADRAYTVQQMEKIVKAFSPGGKGYWKYDE